MKVLPDLRTVFDTGAWVGVYTQMFSKAARFGCHVLAFEPNPVARRHLRMNLSLNNLNNVHVLPCAISDHSGKESFSSQWLGVTVLIWESGRAIRRAWRSRRRVWTTSVPGQTSGLFDRGRRRGHEDKVFAGAKEALARTRSVALECHPVYYSNPESKFKELVSSLKDARLQLEKSDAHRDKLQTLKFTQPTCHFMAIRPKGSHG